MRRALLAVLLGALLLGGCAGMPTDGPVVETETDELAPSGQGAPFIVPLPPREGASAPEVVRGFINAMQAWPSQTATAKEYLSTDAAAAWQPQRSTITYAAPPSPRDVGGDVAITLAGANLLDDRGAWRGELPSRQRTVSYPMVNEDGEWRIDAAPDALMVPEDWFADRYRQVSLYFFDPTASILTPEPIFVPRGDQLATSLIESLLMGPGAGLERVEQSFVPPGLDVFGVTVDDGVADIPLTGDPGQLSPETVELMLVQFAWTLRQDPQIDSLALSIGGQPVPLPGGVASFPVDSGLEYDPAGFQATPLLHGISRGLVVAGTPPLLAPVEGPLGEGRFGLRSIGVNLAGDQVSGVTASGSAVLGAPLASDGEVRTLATGTDFLRPAWDFFDRTWLVDRTDDGARVSHLDADADAPRSVRVPGITGEDVRAFLVSRDGTRLLAVVRRATGEDVLLVSRIQHATSGRVVGATDADRVDVGDDPALEIRDLAWRTSSTVAVLNPLSPTLSQVTSASVDGAPMNPELASTVVDEPLEALAGSPVAGEPIYGIVGNGVVNIASADRRPIEIEQRTRALVYVG